MIKIQNINKTFQTSQGENHALKNVSFELADGSCLVIAGENGSGKSLLMSIIAGLEEADSGSVDLGDQGESHLGDGDTGSGEMCHQGRRKSHQNEMLKRVQHDEEWERLKRVQHDEGRAKSHQVRVGLVFQEAETQILGETPREDIAFGPKNLGWKKAEIEKAVNLALEKTGLEAKADFPARFLSGGEKRRLAIACMIAMNLPIIILDEPYANLDYQGVKQVNSLVKNLKNEGKTVIILSHEIEKCLGLADKFLVLFRGEKVFDGSPEAGLKENLEKWNIKNPMTQYQKIEDFVW